MHLNEHHVRERAYYIWENEGRVLGRADAHWLQAETEIAHAGEATRDAAAATKPAKAASKPAAKAGAKTAAKVPATKSRKSARGTADVLALH